MYKSIFGSLFDLNKDGEWIHESRLRSNAVRLTKYEEVTAYFAK